MTADMEYMKHLREVTADAVALIEEKTGTYGDSWKRRGGPGAWFTVVRPWDRLEGILKKFGGDIFAAIALHPGGEDGTALACVRDIMNYMILIEAHARARLSVGPHGPVRKAKAEGECAVCRAPGSVTDCEAPGLFFCTPAHSDTYFRQQRAEHRPSPASGSHHDFIHPDDAEGEGPWSGPVVAGERLCHDFDARSLGESARADAMERAGEVLDERAQRAGSADRPTSGSSYTRSKEARRTEWLARARALAGDLGLEFVESMTAIHIL